MDLDDPHQQTSFRDQGPLHIGISGGCEVNEVRTVLRSPQIRIVTPGHGGARLDDLPRLVVSLEGPYRSPGESGRGLERDQRHGGHHESQPSHHPPRLIGEDDERSTIVHGNAPVNRNAQSIVFHHEAPMPGCRIDVDEDGPNSSRSRETMDGPDAADVVAAASGDIVAFEGLVRQTQGPVWRYVVHLVGDTGLAEDIAQEVFIRVHRKLHTLQDPERFMPWLLATARNAAYDAGRYRKRRPVELVGDRTLESSRDRGDPHLGLEVRDALDRIDDTLREALVLVAVIGLTYHEAAEITGVPEGTVKSRVFRARQSLVEILQPGVGDA
jgi:RNA polymerase sigma-70 factor (ECF subfamily)